MSCLAIASAIGLFLTLWAIFSALRCGHELMLATELTAFRLFNSVDSFEPSRDCSRVQPPSKISPSGIASVVRPPCPIQNSTPAPYFSLAASKLTKPLPYRREDCDWPFLRPYCSRTCVRRI
jgi:hypothetical protein